MSRELGIIILIKLMQNTPSFFSVVIAVKYEATQGKIKMAIEIFFQQPFDELKIKNL
jgi:hypothetical protein